MDFFTGLVGVLSTTEATTTIDVTAGDSFSWYFEIEEYNTLGLTPSTLPTPTSVVVGDQSTLVNTLTGWLEANGPKQLQQIYIINAVLAATETLYVQVHALDTLVSGASGSIPLFNKLIPPKVGSVNGTLSLNFGNENGFRPISQDANGTDHKGCHIVLSNTPATYTTPASTTTIQALVCP